MNVSINLASRPADQTRPLRFFAVAAGLLAAILCVVAVRSELRSRDEFRTLVDRTSQLQRELAEMEAAQEELEQWLETPQVEQIRSRSALLNSLIRQKSLSWTRMFQDLEDTLPGEARIVSISPRMTGLDSNLSVEPVQQPTLSLAVAAPSVEPLVDFIKNLEDSAEFANTVVEGQAFPTASETEGEIVLTLNALYSQEALPAPPAPASAEDAGRGAEDETAAEQPAIERKGESAGLTGKMPGEQEARR